MGFSMVAMHGAKATEAFCTLAAFSDLRLDNRSWMTGDCHVQS